MEDFTHRVKSWNAKNFRNIFHRKKRLLAQFNDIQKSLYHNQSTFLECLEKDLETKYQHILWLKEEFWALKSRIEWMLLGNRNKNFFHLTTIC